MSSFSLSLFTLTTPPYVQFSISPVVTTSTTAVTPTPRPGVWSLPPNVQRSFSEHFTLYVITEISCSKTPWMKLDVDTVQRHVNAAYPGYEHAVVRGDGFHSLVSPLTPFILTKHLPCPPTQSPTTT